VAVDVLNSSFRLRGIEPPGKISFKIARKISPSCSDITIADDFGHFVLLLARGLGKGPRTWGKLLSTADHSLVREGSSWVLWYVVVG
jgi:hypothetical protein